MKRMWNPGDIETGSIGRGLKKNVVDELRRLWISTFQTSEPIKRVTKSTRTSSRGKQSLKRFKAQKHTTRSNERREVRQKGVRNFVRPAVRSSRKCLSPPNPDSRVMQPAWARNNFVAVSDWSRCDKKR